MSFPFDLNIAAVSDSHLPFHAPTMPFFSRPQRGRLWTAVLCCGLEKNGMVGAWHGHSMASVNQTRSHCVRQMGKTHSKPLVAQHGRGTAWERHAMCESALSNAAYVPLCPVYSTARVHMAFTEHGCVSQSTCSIFERSHI